MASNPVPVVLGADLDHALDTKRQYVEKFPGLAEAYPLSSATLHDLRRMEGLRIGTVYLAPGAYEGRYFAKAMKILERNQAKCRTLGQVVWVR